MAKKRHFGVTYVDSIFCRDSRNFAPTVADSALGLDLAGGLVRSGRDCSDTNHRRICEGRAAHDGIPTSVKVGRGRSESGCRGISRILATAVTRRGLVLGVVIRR